MRWILSGIDSLIQYKNEIVPNLDQLRPEKCIYCGKAHPWRHATYSRKSDRVNEANNSLNSIIIQRYFCPECGKTFSVLPECIPPHRWYPWDIQQAVLILSLLGKSAYAIAKETIPSHHTITRWIVRFNEQFILHKDTLCVRFNEFGRTSGLAEFWQACFEQITLGAAMRLCHKAGVFIP